MKLVVCHNIYRQRGGEERVLEDEEELLRTHGHHVVRFTRDSMSITHEGNLRLAVQTIWNRRTASELYDLVRRERAEVVHFHNTVPLISPAAYYAAKKAGAAVVQTLHNYRFICPSGTFSRNGRVCEDCLGKAFPWPAIRHGCYRNSRAASAVLSTMLSIHRMIGTYANAVDAYIALSNFSRQKLIEGGIPSEKIALKPNFVTADPGPGQGRGGYALFVGRLSHEKGVLTLLDAWNRRTLEIPLKVVGDGPLADRVCAAASENRLIERLPWQDAESIAALMDNASFLVVPSITYEGFPKVIAEASSHGLPVVASRLGALRELVHHERTGLHFEPGRGEALHKTVITLCQQPELLEAMGHEARREYEDRYTADANYRILYEIYLRALRSCATAKPPKHKEEVVPANERETVSEV